MPDTPENQAAYPQLKTQAPGVGFPIARILVVFSLAVGTVLEAAMGPYEGKETSELALLRQIIDQFQPGDIASAVDGHIAFSRAVGNLVVGAQFEENRAAGAE